MENDTRRRRRRWYRPETVQGFHPELDLTAKLRKKQDADHVADHRALAHDTSSATPHAAANAMPGHANPQPLLWGRRPSILTRL
jgi:hypothetical protein